MPFVIAGVLYGLVMATAAAVVGAVCLTQRRPPGRATAGGAVGSAAGFLVGCAAGALACVAGLVDATRFGATAVVVAAGLGGALLGAAAGAAAGARFACRPA